MTQFLPPNLLSLFAPREAPPYAPPLDVLPWEKKPWPYSGVAQYVGLFEDPSETPAPTRAETKDERKTRKQQERLARQADNLKEKIDGWDLKNDPNIDGDPFKTLFVGRINFDTSEGKLRREFEQFGRIKRIKMVMNSSSDKPRGYAFIEYEKERDMHAAYKNADGRKIDGKRVVVDVERGRTVKSWKPRRLGGGLGGTRRGGPNENLKYSGRVDERDMGGDATRGGSRERRRSRSRERRRRSRSKERTRRERSRSRSRDRRRDSVRDRERDRGDRDRGDRDRGDRDRERDRDKDRDRSSRKDKDRDRERDRDREKDKERERDKDKERERDKDKERDRDKDKERERDKDKERDREKDRDKDRGERRHKDRDRDRKRDRDDRDDHRSDKKIKLERESGTEHNGQPSSEQVQVKVET